MRTDWIGAIDDAEAKMGEWSGPALLRAQLDDAIYVMTGRLDEFSAHVDDAGGTVTINGDTMYADEALDTLVSEINAGNGTVTIDGQSVPAQDALRMLTDRINNSDGTVTIEGNNAPANAATDRAKRKADGTTGTIDVNANTGRAESSINSTARNRSSTITANLRPTTALAVSQRLAMIFFSISLPSA